VANASRGSDFSDGKSVYGNFPFERLGDDPESEQPLPGLVGGFEQPFRLRLEIRHNIAGEISAYRGRLFPGSVCIFEGGLNAECVGKPTPTYPKPISRHACD